MFLFTGLGNPDPKYLKNRHNAGFIFLDYFNSEIIFKKKFKSLYAETVFNNNKIFLIKPMTFMNLSGEAVVEIKNFFKLENNNIFIFHDDLDLEVGKIRVKNGGSSGGHNGIESVSEKIGNDYNRVRIGIGHPGEKHLVENYVLNDFNNDEFDLINKCFSRIKENTNLLINKNFEEFSSRVNNNL